ncbi:protein TolQ [Oxalicibacterium flavum]|uniref:Tol-Pal system protein TolQ n=1 Tax=Oxalicibacterium flavum TaxID=179467 RepID=A0A8J2UMP2_9BURK|nr:protein TolQ [Oxalicibacterium flavum]GGB98525.1 protein TolQ [Oxalicibacterium flavum]
MQDTLEHMTIWGLIADASLLVQAVMLILVLASVLSWYLIILRNAGLRRREKELQQFRARFRQTADMHRLYQDTRRAPDDGGVLPVFLAGYHEYLQLAGEPGMAADEVREGVERAMLVAIGEQETQLEQGLSILATVGSVSPYIGLFGTVWGIMNSFIGLSQVQQATLSTVAPGIAEALIATAIGLFAAIPAVIAYNRLSARAATLGAHYYHFGNELQMRLHRLLHGAVRRPAEAMAA